MILTTPALKKSSNVLQEHTMVLQERPAHGSQIKDECPTHTGPTVRSMNFSPHTSASKVSMAHPNQLVQPSVSQPEGSNLQASGHPEVAQILNSELTSLSVQKNKKQIKNTKPQNQIKNTKSQNQIKNKKTQSQIKNQKISQKIKIHKTPKPNKKTQNPKT